MSFSVDKIEPGSPSFQASVSLWQHNIQFILPQLLQLLRLVEDSLPSPFYFILTRRSFAHASHNPANWSRLPPEMRSIVGRVLTDRFWQAGISEGSKDDFYMRVV